jgi:uncharacterized protein YpmB
MKNKKAQLGEITIWIYRFIMIIVVVGAIIAVIVNNYSTPYDVRPLEASLLSSKIVKYIQEDQNRLNSDDIKKIVNIDKDIFINITLENQNVTLGEQLLNVMCATKSQTKKNMPYCFEDSYPLKGLNEKNLTIAIAIGKAEKNA